MKLQLPGREVKVFSVLRRTNDACLHDFSDMQRLIKCSDMYNYSGILLFQTNKSFIDPWVFAQILLASSRNLSPFIAVNPVFMHPFTAAKMLQNISTYHKRRFYLNYIIGTAKSDQESLNDNLDHDQRYERLEEYIQIMDGLLRSDVPVTVSGKYYSVKNLQLPAGLPEELMPGYFIAGTSGKAAELSDRFNSSSLQMAKPPKVLLGQVMPASRIAIHFGIIARATAADASERMQELFNSEIDEYEKIVLDYTMENTDANWKRELALMKEESFKGNTFTILPFKNSKSDCPYHVGSYEDIANVMMNYILEGISAFVIEVPETGEDFLHLDHVFSIAKDRIDKYFEVASEEKFGFSF